MVVGFNHNFRYKSEVYHIQTEDSGLKSPNIVTLLYQGGTILASKKTSYADITKVDNLEQVVEELMKEQHKEMLRKLKAGEFDPVIERFHSTRKRPLETEESKTDAEQKETEKPAITGLRKKPQAVASLSTATAASQSAQIPVSEAGSNSVPTAPAASAANSPSAPDALSLDDMILSYLIEDEK